ncbi:SusC/RagA family TonB-linked outer membrane protein [Sphingobacterium rhinopitheci]|uniref:SusC/RagA family TonB-linked outer membrane protein n=1 Tax=Sphingobacterium rhinopitheci TaxID=2781960 RepID=UPI001F518A39|nr:TonB-dependent receptor [Sphingobacterium rhinopitheci]MCI0921064.1 TonB-dependent receptor [Sphingobacterium rhinopitheci]
MMNKIKNPYLGKFYPITSALMLALIVSQTTYASTHGVVEMPITNRTQQTIIGNVSAEGSPLDGVTVSIKEKPSVAVSTDSDGHFSINASIGQTLVFKRIGYATHEQKIDKNNLQVILQSTNESLEEVVVVGFGTQKKANLTGAVQAISAKDLQDRPITNASTAMQGKFAGVTITQNSGQPGKDGGTIRIRGLGTINNSNPLVIVDGIESSLNNINPNDIENISVLKDGPSAAIYGSKAANGVILVTTKKGKIGEPQLNYAGYAGWQSPTSLPQYMRSYDNAIILNEALTNEGRALRFTDEEIEGFKTHSNLDKYPDTDWLGLLYTGSGFQQSHNIQLSGATEKINYMASVGYLGQKGVIPVAESNRYNIRTNIGAKITERLHVNLGIAYNYQKINEPVNPYTGDMAQIFRQANRIPSFIAYKYSNGYYGYYGDGNPIAWLDMKSMDRINNKHTQINFSGEYKIFEGLKFKQVVGFQPFDNTSSKFVKEIQFYNNLTGAPTQRQGVNNLTVYNAEIERLTLQSLLTYDKSFGKNQINALAGFMDETNTANYSSAYRQGFLNTNLEELVLGDSEGQVATGGARKNILRSFFGRLNYSFDGKYLIEGNIRHDGTSRFIGTNKWSTFPSFSAGWRISQESFFQNSSLANSISELKLRGGWGKLGNQTLIAVAENTYPSADLYYPALDVFTSGYNYPIGSGLASGGTVVSPGNPMIRWEETVSTNIGIDLNFKNNLGFVIDYFDRKTNDMLLEPPVPAQYGVSRAPYFNAAKGRNRGIELQVNYSNQSGELKYNISANASYIKNELADWNQQEQPYNSYFVYKIGAPMRSFYGYETLGIYRTDEEYKNSGVIGVNNNVGAGDLIYKDQNGDGKIDGQDRVYLGSPDPKYIFGLTANFNYKAFDLSMFFQGAADVKGYLWGEAIGTISGSGKPNIIFEDRFNSVTNPNGSMPRALTTWVQNSPENTPSDFWLQNASYLRLKNITLGYNLPQHIVSRMGIKGLKVYYSGQNLLTFTSFMKGFDPEAPASTRGNYYPQVITNTFGLNINF